jgi:electron transport complex protein RnfA
MLVIYIFSTIREKMEVAPIMPSFRGLPIALITASVMALIFARYIGA